jgi:hypothetical protein
MVQLNPLPERLQYLQPFRKKFAMRPDDLNENTGYTPLLELLQKRIAGHSNEAAAKLLAEDITELQNWLAAPEQVNDCLHFTEGVFLIASPADLIKQINEEAAEQRKPLPWVEMELPLKVKPRRFEKDKDGGMLVKWNEHLFSVSIANEEWVAKNEKPGEFWSPKETVTCTPVQFGQVTGLKYVGATQKEFALPERPVIQHRRIIYILATPGGHVKISLSCNGKKPNLKWDELKLMEWRREQVKLHSNWDEKPVESFFHSLRIILKQPQNN